MASLRELQRSFAAALRDPDAACAVRPEANLAIYRNNTDHSFRAALELGFPVLRRRVGDDYFHQLAHQYRARFPSRSGDLHWVGRDFAAFLDTHLAGGEYHWLSDLARLEWARECAAIGIVAPHVGPEALAALPADRLEHAVFALQPSLQLIESPYPVFSVWLANQTDNAPPMDQSRGSEQGMARARTDGVEIARLEPDLFSYLSALAAGRTLGEAMTLASLDGPRLTQVLGHLFSEGLVTTVRSSGQETGASS
jgi:hypothetical protein